VDGALKMIKVGHEPWLMAKWAQLTPIDPCNTGSLEFEVLLEQI